MKRWVAFIGFATAGGIALAGCAAGRGAMPVAAHPDPAAALADTDPQLAANKRLVFDMWRNVVNAGRVEMADAMLQPGYVQHSPMLPTGREAFKRIFAAVPRTEAPATVSPPLVAILAEGDLVVMALREEMQGPGGSGPYTTTHFNLFRVEDGRLAEHWHSLQGVPGPNVALPEAGGPQPVTGLEGAAQLALLDAADPAIAANKRLVFDAWRTVIEGGQANLAHRFYAATYVEHDPNHRSGLAGVRAQARARGARAVEPAARAPLVALLAQNDLVVMIYGRVHPHPHHPGRTYTTALFEMFRIEQGRIAEHWNGGTLPGGSLGPYAG